MIVRIDYPQPQARLDLWGGASGAFAGLDRFGRVVDQRWQNAVATTPADADRYQYGYDRDSNRAWKRNAVAGASVPLDEFYAYDRLNRLNAMQRGTLTGTPPTGIAGTPVLEQDWTLDPTGNWRGYAAKAAGATTLDQARAGSPVNQITAITETAGPAWADPAYDPAGNTTSFPKPADPTQSFAATYDAWNRLAGVDDGSGPVARYAYDGRNRRVVSERYASGVSGETRHAYYTSGWQNVEERVGTSTTADTQHVWGVRYVDELVCRDDAAATPMRRVYACQDANFNVTALLGTTGTVLQRFVYEPYGADSARDAAWAVVPDAYAWRVRFQGLPLDLPTGLDLARNREYHPPVGGWMQRDQSGYSDGENLLQFLSSNPTRYVDPFGFQPGLPNGQVAYPVDQLISDTVQGDNGKWMAQGRALGVGMIAAGAEGPTLSVGISYYPNKDVAQCNKIDILQLTQVAEMKNGAPAVFRKIPDPQQKDLNLTSIYGWGVDSPTVGKNAYYTSSAPGASHAYILNNPTDAGKFAFVRDAAHPDNDRKVFAFNFVDIAQVTAGKDKGRVLDAIEWGFVTDPKAGVLPRSGFDNKTIIRKAQKWSADTGAAIGLWDQQFPNAKVIPFTW